MNSAVTHDPEHSRFQLLVDGEVRGTLAYTRDGDVWALTHTEVDPALGGHGLGSELVVAGLRAIRDDGGRVLPLCPFVPKVIADHPEFQELVVGG